jgi:excisionase family DNA binding protein
MAALHGQIRGAGVIAAAARKMPMRLQPCVVPSTERSSAKANIVTTIHSSGSPHLGNLIDIPTLADWLGISVRHVRRLVAEKRIPYIKVGYFIRFDAVQIRHWLEDHTHDVSA